MKLSKFFFVFFIAFGLNACGYHLRGMGDTTVKFKRVYLEGASEALMSQFDKVLKMSSAKLTKNSQEADLHVKVVNETFNRRTASLNFSGRSNQYDLNYRLEFEIAGADNVFLGANNPLEINRSYFNDQGYVIAKDQEENVIRGEMYKQAVISIFDRAQSQIKK